MGSFDPVIVKYEETDEKIGVKKEVNVVRFKESIEVAFCSHGFGIA